MTRNSSILGALGLALFFLTSPVLSQAESVPLNPIKPEQLIGAPAAAPISGDELDERTEALASRMRCPVCQALSVADSPSLSAMAIKEEVRELLAAGYTEDQVISYFEQAYGEFIRLAPKPQGFNLVVWLAPGLALLVGAWLVLVRFKTRPASVVEDSGSEEDPELAAFRERVKQEVAG